jgi:hypothetical protein
MVLRPLIFDLVAITFRDQDSKVFVVTDGGLAAGRRRIVYEKFEALDEHC